VTIVSSLIVDSTAIVVADSRISVSAGTPADRPLSAQDVSQKLIDVGSWAVAGFAGDLCLGSDVLHRVTDYMERGDPYPIDWVSDTKRVRQLIERIVAEHAKKSGHKKCLSRQLQLLIVWIDREPQHRVGPATANRIFDAPPRTVIHLPARLESTKVTVFPNGAATVTRKGRGLEMIGSGAAVSQELEREEEGLASFVSRMIEPGMRAAGQSGLLLIFIDALMNKHRILDVGSLFQVSVLTMGGLEHPSYWYFAPVEEGWGTWLLMRYRNDIWVQEHRPTGQRIELQVPWDIPLTPLEWSSGKFRMIDPRSLKPNSPGVVQDAGSRGYFVFQTVFEPYLSPEIPEPVQPSWGIEPVSDPI